jgi:LmbE family N-acetylglucosaminyl deacetylase
MEPITVLSPHRDDAGFSLGLALSAWSAASVELRVLNFFTQSAYSPHSSAETVGGVSAIREEEDQRALAFIHPRIEVISLDLLDAPLRLHIPFSQITQPESAEKISLAELEQLSRNIKQHCAGSLLVAPLSLGNHVDHVAVHYAAIQSCLPERLAFYEDLPYATWTSPEDLQSRIAFVGDKTGIPLEPLVVQMPDGVTRKRQIASFYRSQITAEEAHAIAQFSQSYGSGERLWLPIRGEAWNVIRRLATKPPQTATPGPPK